MSKSRKPGLTLYVVERAAYRTLDYDGLHYLPCESDEGASYTPVRGFADRSEAERCRAELEAEARASLSPALFASYTLPKDLTRRIESLGLEPPKLSKEEHNRARDFRKWWVEHAGELTAEQQSALWALFADVKLYRVRESKLQG
jgi:hypothetical protein